MTGHEPAFPGGISATAKATDDAFPTQTGMSLRAYLAAKAMQGLCANAELYAAFQKPRKTAIEEGIPLADIDAIERKAIAQVSLAFADALIAELNKGEKP